MQWFRDDKSPRERARRLAKELATDTIAVWMLLTWTLHLHLPRPGMVVPVLTFLTALGWVYFYRIEDAVDDE